MNLIFESSSASFRDSEQSYLLKYVLLAASKICETIHQKSNS